MNEKKNSALKDKKENSNIRFVDTKEKRFISTKQTTKRVLEYIDECSKDVLKKEKKEDKKVY